MVDFISLIFTLRASRRLPYAVLLGFSIADYSFTLKCLVECQRNPACGAYESLRLVQNSGFNLTEGKKD